jgi:hypothetical protein
VSLLEFLDNKISLGNYLFPETAYSLIGFTRNRSGSLMVVVDQPYIRHIAKTIRDPEVFASYCIYLAESGWNMDESNVFTIWNDDFIVHDLHEDNILIDELGGFYFIDTNPKLYTSRYGGSRRYGNGELVDIADDVVVMADLIRHPRRPREGTQRKGYTAHRG